MRPEGVSEPNPDRVLPCTGTFSLDQAYALRQVLHRFGLPFRIVANEGARYPDGDARVPKGAAFVTYDIGEVPVEVIGRMVEEIAPTPMVDGRGRMSQPTFLDTLYSQIDTFLQTNRR